MSHDLLKISHWWKFYLSKKNSSQDLLSSLNATLFLSWMHHVFDRAHYIKVVEIIRFMLFMRRNKKKV